MKAIHIIAFLLIVIGGLNWGLVGIGGEGWNVVAMLGATTARVIYIIVGVAAVVELVTHKWSCKACTTSGQQM